MTDTSEKASICNQVLADKLFAMTAAVPSMIPAVKVARSPQEADAIVGAFEINDCHGTGVLIQRLFGTYKNIVSIRSKDLYQGRQEFGAMHVRISHGEVSRDKVVRKVLEALGGATVSRVLCVPFLPDDALTAIALREAFGIPLCTFLMDDQNLCSDGISDAIMGELFAKSSLRLAISPEMCIGYERKYNTKVWFMPPLAPTRLIPHQLSLPAPFADGEKSAVMLGNIWGQQWVELLRTTIRGSGITVRWYNNGEFRWLPCSKEELINDGIVPQEGPPHSDDALVEILRAAPFIVLPSGTLDDRDDRKPVAQLSFPSRIPYILATSHSPILVMGSPETAAARLITRLGIGAVVPYERTAFLEAAERISSPEVNLSMRRTAFLLSIRFADVAGAEWIWHSLAKGKAFDSRYEDLIPAADVSAVK